MPTWMGTSVWPRLVPADSKSMAAKAVWSIDGKMDGGGGKGRRDSVPAVHVPVDILEKLQAFGGKLFGGLGELPPDGGQLGDAFHFGIE